ncbi:alpha/beta hydrolase-fold protein [Acidobacteriota bacterium]
MIAVTFQHPCPYYDDSYAVNSPNVGPYGDAILEELIPYIEEHFRIIRKPYARVLSGGSTGGWESFALQVFHPDFFGGTWSLCPDPLDFRYYQIVNIYENKNAYYRDDYEWLKVERPDIRKTDGSIDFMMKDENFYEYVVGDKSRGGGQWDIWEAVFGPIGEDGYPKPIWDKLTGEIDHEVAEYWKENFDLRYYLEKNWSWLGPKLAGKLHIYTGDMDNCYLNNAVVLIEEFLEKTTEPYYDGVVVYGDRQPHCWGPRGAELFQLFEKHITKNASTWKY